MAPADKAIGGDRGVLHLEVGLCAHAEGGIGRVGRAAPDGERAGAASLGKAVGVDIDIGKPCERLKRALFEIETVADIAIDLERVGVIIGRKRIGIAGEIHEALRGELGPAIVQAEIDQNIVKVAAAINAEAESICAERAAPVIELDGRLAITADDTDAQAREGAIGPHEEATRIPVVTGSVAVAVETAPAAIALHPERWFIRALIGPDLTRRRSPHEPAVVDQRRLGRGIDLTGKLVEAHRGTGTVLRHDQPVDGA